jgi:hypothetical protein
MSKLTIAHLIKMSFENIIGHAFAFLAKDIHSNIYTSHFQLSTMPTQICNLHNELNLFECYKLMELCVSSYIILNRLVNKAHVNFQHCTQTTLKTLIWMDFCNVSVIHA